MDRLSANLAKLVGAAALAASVVSITTLPAAGQSQAQAPALDQAVAALRGISTMRADFVQTDRNGQSVRGVMTLKRPGKIRFEYQKGVNYLVVGNGKSLTFVDYDVQQVQRWPIKNSPLGALLDPARDVSRYGTLRPTANPDVISIEVRDRSHPEYGVMTLIFVREPSAPGGLELSHWVALDSQNKMTTVQLSNQRYGVSVPDSTFTYNDPRPRVRR